MTVLRADGKRSPNVLKLAVREHDDQAALSRRVVDMNPEGAALEDDLFKGTLHAP
jgi:hypothetical protein